MAGFEFISNVDYCARAQRNGLRLCSGATWEGIAESGGEYRFLDKRFYYGKTVEMDLRELALRKLRMSENYNVAHMKRILLKGIEELQSHWELKSLPDSACLRLQH